MTFSEPIVERSTHHGEVRRAARVRAASAPSAGGPGASGRASTEPGADGGPGDRDPTVCRPGRVPTHRLLSLVPRPRLSLTLPAACGRGELDTRGTDRRVKPTWWRGTLPYRFASRARRGTDGAGAWDVRRHQSAHHLRRCGARRPSERVLSGTRSDDAFHPMSSDRRGGRLEPGAIAPALYGAGSAASTHASGELTNSSTSGPRRCRSTQPGRVVRGATWRETGLRSEREIYSAPADAVTARVAARVLRGTEVSGSSPPLFNRPIPAPAPGRSATRPSSSTHPGPVSLRPVRSAGAARPRAGNRQRSIHPTHRTAAPPTDRSGERAIHGATPSMIQPGRDRIPSSCRQAELEQRPAHEAALIAASRTACRVPGALFPRTRRSRRSGAGRDRAPPRRIGSSADSRSPRGRCAAIRMAPPRARSSRTARTRAVRYAKLRSKLVRCQARRADAPPAPTASPRLRPTHNPEYSASPS